LMLLEGVMLLIYVIFVFYVIRKALTVTMIIAAWGKFGVNETVFLREKAKSML